MKDELVLIYDDTCFACGKNNHQGLKLEFLNRNGKILSQFTASSTYQGYKGIVHGGIICTLLDEAMVYAAIEEGSLPITAELTVRFKNPLKVGETALIEAEVTKKTSRLTLAQAKLTRKTDGELIASAMAKIIKK
ncbi:MAG: PaaI family thioesterase [Thermodesulfovibrionales bacterium]|nr:PaaI family thioesterase [Thermodesulfovibrionales bacterium]